MSAGAALDEMLTVLTADVPTVQWKLGRLSPAMAHKTLTLGAISSLNEVVAPNGQSVIYTIMVQAFLPVDVISPNNLTMTTIGRTSPKDILALVDDIRNALHSMNNGDSGVDYASLSETRVDYPADPNNQQTRAEIQFTLRDYGQVRWM